VEKFTYAAAPVPFEISNRRLAVFATRVVATLFTEELGACLTVFIINIL
jgi:hypothetical protein